MNIQLKQRLVGAVVLVSLAVILIPLLLPGEGSLSQAPRGSSIPPRPDYRFPPLPESPPAPAPAPAPAVPVEELPEPPAKGAPTAPDLPVDAATPARETTRAGPGEAPATGWVVQLASFSRAANARALRDRLRQAGHAAFVEKVEDGKGGTVYRVRVGPELRRDLAERLRQRLARETKLDGLVLQYP